MDEDQKVYDVLVGFEMTPRIVVAEFKTWSWLERIAVVMILVSITGIVLTGIAHQAKRHTKSAVPAGDLPHHRVSLPAASAAEHTVTVPEQDTKALVATASVVSGVLTPLRGTSEPRQSAGEPNTRGFRLGGRGSVVVLAVTEADAAELLQHPNKLVQLIQSGSLFSVPNDTAVPIAESHAGLAQVHVLVGAFQGKDGWVRADHVMRK